ncbi:hypothetical protein GCM10027093_04540 [Paraburkholderia jirisanensis]
MASAMNEIILSPASRVHAETLKSLLDAAVYREAVQDVIRRTGSDHADAEHQVIECLRYLYLLSVYPQQLMGLFLPVEQSIDDVWHYLILQTREYRALCEEGLPGRIFIEHRSLPYAEYQQEPRREHLIEEALRWLPLYRDTFGAFDEHGLPYWTMARFLRDQIGLSNAQIAALGN